MKKSDPSSPQGLFAIPQKNKINLYFMDRLAQILNDDLKSTER
jgi:hypothetical protein